ncbi:Ferripyoverdine receptor precursor [Delftia tsuruhatensis]|uniref:TonB-dependent siderophore receptor n=1 Tax=Delftia tsuruhatensis TaxID=180282 RepID=UPI001E722B23|nr:TonB-dependent siderophore receptor [Delftia tsuruhatensis]CAB5716220.1 Ferripyoverdine receptor precursor [Delftia tsuruhatensis]CAC9686099.1 Ferripyoverdine receptor precursor [Delftia tsuruhatensis]
MALQPAARRMAPAPFPLNQAAMAVLMAAGLAAGTALPRSAQAQPAAASASPALRQFQVPSGPLAAALAAFAADAGVSISAPPALVQGRRTEGVQGSHTVREALDRLLAGSDLQALSAGAGGYVLETVAEARRAAPAVDTALAEVRVTARAERSAVTEGTGGYAAAGSSSTATRLGLSQRETPQSLSVITREQIEDRGFQSLEEVALDATGLSTRQIGGGERTQFFVRGFEVNSFLADGVPLAFDYDTQGLATMAMYDRVEVLRGAAGLMTGTGNPSGTINLVRKRPTDTPQVALTGSLGSWSNRRGEIDASGPLNAAGSLRGRAVIALQDTDTFKRSYRHERQLVYGTLEADIAPRTKLSLGGYYNREDNPGADWNGLPTRRDGSFYPLLRSARVTPDWAYWNKENASLFAELEHGLGHGWKTQLTARVLQSRMDMLGTYLYPLEDSQDFGQGVGAYAYKKTQYSLDAFAQGPWQWLGRTHEMVFGASVRQNSDDDGPGGWPSDYQQIVDPMTWDPGSVARPAINTLWSRRGHQRQLGAYGTLRLSVSQPLTALLGARVDSYSYDMLTRSGEWSDSSRYRVHDRITPYAGLVYALDSRHSAYASWTSVFQPQSNQGASGALLDPVTGRNLELGVKGEYAQGRLQASAALFQINQKNLPLQLPQSQCSPTVASCYAQTGEVRSRGVEFEVAGAVTPSLQLMAGYTYNRAQHVRDSDVAKAGTPYDTQTPRHLLKLSARYQLPGAWQRWSLGGSVRTRSETRSAGYGVRQGGYTLVDLTASYQFSRQLDIRLNINNLTDKYYYQAIGSTQDNNHFGAPRNVLLTARYRF